MSLYFTTRHFSRTPCLARKLEHRLNKERVSYRTFADSLNPPILHRKELMLPDNHPRRSEFHSLTKAAETIGLFQNPTRIGFREQWLRLVQESGYRIAGHELIPIANDELAELIAGTPTDNSIARHLTALVRYGFSAPVQALARYGLKHKQPN